jgi:hypothetical protein
MLQRLAALDPTKLQSTRVVPTSWTGSKSQRCLAEQSYLYRFRRFFAARVSTTFTFKVETAPGVVLRPLPDQESGLPWSPLFTPVNQSGHPAKLL